MVCIDGAHVPGQLDLNISSLNPDFFVGNLHKWCYAMRGCALIYVAKEHQENCHPIATSHNYKCDFQDRFFDQGTDDITNYLIVPEALEYYHSIGGQDPNSYLGSTDGQTLTDCLRIPDFRTKSFGRPCK